MMTIKNLIFDWGGVLTIGRYTPSLVAELQKISEHVLDVDRVDGLVCQMDSGKLSYLDFCTAIVNMGVEDSSEKIDLAFKSAIKWNSNLVSKLNKFKIFNLYILSNNNPKNVEILKNDFSSLLDNFKGIYFSCEYKMTKPNSSFFELMLHDADILAEESIFVDDKEKNILAASRLGFKAILFISNEQLEKDLNSLAQA
ncbi:HAD-IA family hydrolase [Candidatus Woesearchaeota archaeon]|nr:HAD-IA family hydrolase [Candidatus Woesearchaeota archaeon]